MRAVAILSALWFSTAARATLCPAPFEGPALASIDSERRLSFLLHALEDNAARLHVWSLTWGSVYAGATAAQVAAIPFVQGNTRDALIVGATAAAIGSLTLYLLPLRLTRTAHFERWDLAGADRCLVLARVERRFLDSAQIDRLTAGWFAQAGNLAVNTVLAIAFGLVSGHWLPAVLGALLGLAVGEANVLTQPHGLVTAEARYLAGAIGQPAEAPGHGLSTVLRF